MSINIIKDWMYTRFEECDDIDEANKLIEDIKYYADEAYDETIDRIREELFNEN